MTTNKHQSHTHQPLSRWFISHMRAIQFSFREFIRSPFLNLITICVIGIALALPLGFFIVLDNLQYVDTVWDSNTPTISLYLKSDTTDTQANAIVRQLQQNKDISRVTYISPDQGLAAFANNTTFGDAVKLFQKNPIPSVIVVTPIMQDHDPQAIQTLYLALKQSPAVDIAQLDMDWVTRLFDFILIGKNLVKALSILFGLGVILIIGHTLRSSLSSHTKEIQVMKLIGATNAYIRRPLLYCGILYGLLGGVVAVSLVSLFLSQIQAPVSQLAQTYHTLFQLQTISFSSSFLILLITSTLGFISAMFIITQFLNLPEQVE